MIKRLLVPITFLLLSITSNAQIQPPQEFLGYELGTQFSRHHQVVDYFKYVSENSQNVELIKYGKTNEQRDLHLAYISSVENLKNLESIREDNLKKTGILEGTSSGKTAIVWLSYNVHGNESCSTEAAMKTVYELITKKQDWLENTVIIMDPCVNPDGRDRYVNWYNQVKSSPYNNNPETTEHQEPWPGGRSNHYLFDLNRDWMWITQVESQHRLKMYNKWMPHVHVDFHEQGVNNPYYFAPAAAPYHEIVTDWQVEFQTAIGKNHARYFDAEGWRYFTKESFDLLYPSYGDTYPTFMGAIGMTYEQGGSGRAGLGILNDINKELSLKDRLTHHHVSGLSTVEMASIHAEKLVAEFESYYKSKDLKYQSFILRGDAKKLQKVAKLLGKHDIQMRPASVSNIKGYDYESGNTTTIRTDENDWVVSTDQPKGKMVHVLFEPETKLADSATYDITAWSIPFAYGLKGFATSSLVPGKEVSAEVMGKTGMNAEAKAYAYISDWKSIEDAQLLGALLEEGFNVRFSNRDFQVEGQSFKAGSLVVMKGENDHIKGFDAKIAEINNRRYRNMTAVKTGFVDSGYDFGSRNYSLVSNKKIAVLSGDGTSSYRFGEIWHFFETQLKYPLQVLNNQNLGYLKLSNYDVLILPGGFRAKKEQMDAIVDFAKAGGTVLAMGTSLGNFADKEGFALKRKKSNEEKEDTMTAPVAYSDRSRERIKNSISGSIFKSTLDPSHPLAFGYINNYYSLKVNSSAYELLKNGSNVGYYPSNTKKVAGFAGVNASKLVPNSLLFGVENKGSGKIIYMVDNPLYRSFWENGKLFIANAVFFN